ncbi:MAG: synthase epsilon chain [Candidatus Saccharibacteria bacterium]|nr:synthase epsilon chain [Candidatus Saccharibacteria bacterium]
MAGSKSKFTLSVISQKEIVYYGNCDVLFVPSDHDVVAIMAYHTPMIMKLGKGKVVMRDGSSDRELGTVETGLLYVGDNQVSVLI